MIGDIPGHVCSKTGSKLTQCKMQNVKYCSENKYSLFSLTKQQRSGLQLHMDDNSIWITKGEQKVKFDIKILTKEGIIFAAYIQKDIGTEAASAGTEEDHELQLNVNKANDLLGHSNKDETR
eukprot:12256308-Ditylum_brightwellii.AAC.1